MIRAFPGQIQRQVTDAIMEAMGARVERRMDAGVVRAGGGRAGADRLDRRDVGPVRECGRGSRAQPAVRRRAGQCGGRREAARRQASAGTRRARQQGQPGRGARPVARGG
ncbi:hypothetical protein BVI434_460004 [Burkholderia vietnamiensis]|nr:hypothetical protein BVI434_460004 [Burkholderia vietnamiensis]